ncbi:hypothetical protein [Phyllobacterium meliloti]|uniref:hypothetical protein n=1 Tax=Phyllobacterium meliloti TaxID=555317 RepID=UPI001D13F5AD|nr:hypothetical protein [Phyllobacterium sp. T1293]UGX87149.1 hypothetical protein LLE53_004690 [Phyllobacterium sp. T1293]
MPRRSGFPSTRIAMPGNQRSVLNLSDEVGTVTEQGVYRRSGVAMVFGDVSINLVIMV